MLKLGPEHNVPETYQNTAIEKYAYINAEAEAIHMILSGIRDDIYLTVDACTTAKEIWIDIERLQQAYKEDNDPKQAQRDKQIHKSLALIAKHFKNIYKPTNNNLRTSSNTKNKKVDTSPRIENDSQTGQFVNQRTVIVTRNKKTIGNQEERGVSLSAEHDEWLHDTDEELDKQELEAHYMYMAKIQEVLSIIGDDIDPFFDSEPLEKVQFDDEYQPENMKDITLMEKVNSNTTPDSSDMCNDEFKDNQNANDDEDGFVMLLNSIANLKLDTDENKKIQKQLKKENTTLTHELNESKSALKESNDILDRCRSALHQKDIELDKYKVYKNCKLEKNR
nr:ribonuclease H-like domain-containing protein [Tanacetum cinerariifolium]